MNKTTSTIFLTLFCLVSCTNQSTANWLPWEAVELDVKTDNKKIVVWVHDDSCSTCVESEKRIFTPQNNSFINQYFHAIKLGVHSTETITTKGKTYKYIQNLQGGGYHELAVAITQSKEKIAYPALVFLDSDMNIITPLKEDIEEEELTLLLKYVEGDHFMNMDIESYKQIAFK